METETARTGRTDRSKVRAVGRERRSYDGYYREGDTITEKGKVAADKAKELAAIANLKSQISTCEEVMKKNYLEIGKIYFEQYSDMPEPPFEKQCETIKNSQRAIADLQEKIEQLKTK